MKIAGLVILACLGSGAACYYLIPADTFMFFKRPDGGTVALSRTGIELERPPDHYARGAFDHLDLRRRTTWRAMVVCQTRRGCSRIHSRAALLT